jgi:hypothetical protein
MPKLQWILASMLGPSGWRLDVLMVRVTSFSRVLFVGLAWAVSPPAAQFDEGRTVIDAAFEVVGDDCVPAPDTLGRQVA